MVRFSRVEYGWVKYSLAMVMHRFVWSGNGVVSFSDVMYSNGNVSFHMV